MGDGRRVGKEVRRVEAIVGLGYRPGTPKVVEEAPTMVIVEVVGPKLDGERERVGGGEK